MTKRKACVWVVEYVHWLTDEDWDWRPIYQDAYRQTRADARTRAYNARSDYDTVRVAKYVRAGR
jgi:hypothetical protein